MERERYSKREVDMKRKTDRQSDRELEGVAE